MKTPLKTALALGLTLLLAVSAMASDQIRYNYIPETISPEAQKELAAIYDAKAYTRVFPEADDHAGWKKTHAEGEAGKVDASKKAVAEITRIFRRLF